MSSFCPEDWAKLRGAIDARGLTRFVAPDGATAAERMKRWAAGERTEQAFDPLLLATVDIAVAAAKDVRRSADPAAPAAAAALLNRSCPLCMVRAQSAELADEWLDGCADDQLDRARALGLVSTS